VFYRREGETTWKLLKEGLTDTILVWDTASAPNGSYVVKIVASDHKSNPPETALRGERESASFDIDNTPPDSRREVFSLRLEADAAGRTLVIRVTDALNNMSAGQVTLPAAARPQN
jgi:hypothetical protein